MAVTSFEQPQFFMILGPEKQKKLLERARFPILFAVAQKIRNEQYSTISQFVSTTNSSSAIVQELYEIHTRATAQLSAQAAQSSIDFLTDYTERE